MYKSNFPIFTTHPDLVYLDSAASAQKPAAVIEAVDTFYRTTYANIHRGLYELSTKSTEQYEHVRELVAGFIEAASPREVIFTKGATEALNFLAHSLITDWKQGDEILLSELEHHANLLPWRQLAERFNLKIQYAGLTPTGEIDLKKLPERISEKTRIISLAHCSNVLGTITPFPLVKKIRDEQGSQAFLIADASQSVPHFPVSVHELGVDFLTFSGHKLYAPSGTGVLWGREPLLQQLPPYQTGGEMVKMVSKDQVEWEDIPNRFEAGTPNIEGVIGLGAAIQYLQKIGMQNVAKHITTLHEEAVTRFASIPQVKILGVPAPESGIISFTIEGLHPHDLAQSLAERQICIRAGHHCAGPLHQFLEITASSRISFGLYTTKEDIATFFTALAEIMQFFHV